MTLPIPALWYSQPCPAHSATSCVNGTSLAVGLAGGLALRSTIWSGTCRATTRRVVHMAISHYIRFATRAYADELTLDEGGLLTMRTIN